MVDSDGDLATVQSKKNANNAFWNYANRFTYNAAGAVTSMQLGNGRWESTKFNERLQPTQIALGKTAPVVNGQQVTYSTELLKLEYQYGDLNWDGTVLSGTNNGNVAKQTITVAGVGATPGFTAVQNYDYDSLNRIQIANETLTPTSGTAETWTQEFRYDRYGNRTFWEPTTTTLPKECNGNTEVCAAIRPVVNPSVNPADNKLNGYTFDSAGNTIRDAENRKFTYDAENKQTKVEAVNSNGDPIAKIGEYWYDGDGRRVKKRAYVNDVLTEETIFVYDAGGKLIGEYSNEVASAQDAKVAYLTNDHLGSPRINTDLNGNVIARHDYRPFGEDIASSKRVVGIGYASDTVRKQFTGYETDVESQLDFAEARMFSRSLARFYSADPYNIVMEKKVDKPEDADKKLVAYLLRAQQWNRYSYVTNNPLIYVDPSGQDLELTGTRAEQNEAFKRILELCGEKCAGKLYQEIINGRTYVKFWGDGGGLAAQAGKIGVVLEEIIKSDTLVQLQVTSKTEVTAANGENVSLGKGADTELISSKHIQIFLLRNASMARVSDSQWVLGIKAEDGSKLVNTPSVIFAHELGHAWGAINERTYDRYTSAYRVQIWKKANIISENNEYSVMVENWQRDRLGLKHRAGH